MNRAVFLDRDGVLNKPVLRNGKTYPPASVSQLEIMRDAPVALTELKKSGFLLVVVTNQPDVGRGTQDRNVVEAINEKLKENLPLDDFLTCYHDESDACQCRKPQPGLLFQAARQHKIVLSESFFIGDRWRDVEAAFRAGCKAIFIDYGYQEQQPLREPNARVSSLREAVKWILARA